MKPKGNHLQNIGRFAVIVNCLVFGLTVFGQQQDFSRVLGDWTGESICVGGNNPVCHDEQVIYHFAKSKTDPQKLTLAADKIVNGKPEPMYEQELTYDSAKQTLAGEFHNPRYHGLWEYTIKGSTMWGTLIMLPERTVVRNIRVTRIDANQSKTEMTNHATGSFDVKLVPQNDDSDDKSLGRMTVDKQWHGDVEGISKGQMLSGGDVSKGSAGYVAIEKFTGTLKGHKGSFILQHNATMTKTKGDLSIIVIPDSGTDGLAGISGKLTIRIENGKHFYDFEYSLK